jgi:serine/threonine-protein kinase
MRETIRDEGGLIAGRYRLIRRIGSGGMGSVWQAADEKLQRNVAVKLVAARARNEGHVVQRFVQEATLIAKLKSPHVVEIHDFGFDDLYPYLVMELLQGDSLKKRLGRDDRVSLDEAKRWAVQLGKALSAAHAMGIVHRDLKPANVILVSDGDDEILKVFDFGIAKAFDQARITKQMLGDDVMLGTPGFMSPEQVRGEDVDARSDLWALGVLLYRAISGHMPFPGAAMSDILISIVRTDPPPPSRFVPSLPVEVDMFMARALAKEPGSRFQTARELVAAFRSIASTATEPAVGASIVRTAASGPAPLALSTSPLSAPDAVDDATRVAPRELSDSTTVAVTRSRRSANPELGLTPTHRGGQEPARSRHALLGAVALGGLLALIGGAAVAYLTFRGPSAPSESVEPAAGEQSAVGGPAAAERPGSSRTEASETVDAGSAAGGGSPSSATPSAEAADSASARTAAPSVGTAPTQSPSAAKSSAPRVKPTTSPSAAPRTGTTAAPDLFSEPW